MIRHGGYDYTLDDARATVGALDDWWSQLTHGRDPSVALDVARSMASVLAAQLGTTVVDGPIPPELERLGALGRAQLDETNGARLLTAVLGGVEAMTAALRVAGEIPTSGSGRVVRLSRSNGGVPKLSVPEVLVGPRGLDGDAQASRRHHGRPWQALCLWSKEVIDGFAAQGHPIGYGSAGENVTIEGLVWEEMRSGVRLRIGTVLADLSLFALPCTKNSPWFLDGDHTLMHHDRGSVSRVYAWVREPGTIAEGDRVEVV